jgi:heptosyltransferase-3
MQAGKRILIYRLGSLGDTIAALPVFNKIVDTFPGADITLLTNRPIMAKAAAVESVLGSDHFFNRVLNYPIGTRNPKLLFKLIKQIRAFEPDAVCYIAAVRNKGNIKKAKLTVWRDKLFFRAAGIKYFIGLPAQPEDLRLDIDAETGELEWEPKRLARRFAELGNINLQDERVWDLHFSNSEQQQAQDILNTFTSGQPFIAVSIGTKNQSNDWEAQNWLSFLKKLGQTQPEKKLIMLGANDEMERANLCLQAWGRAGLNLCGQTSPRVSALILKQAHIFIGHDSGPMHLAACVGTPCVSIFSARNLPRQWYPRGDHNKIIYHKTDCAGCGIDVCIVQQKKCILSITVDEVHQAVMEILTNIVYPPKL